MKRRTTLDVALMLGIFCLAMAGPAQGAQGVQGDSRPFVSACEPPALGFQQTPQASPLPPGICQLIGVVDPSGEAALAVVIDPGYVTSCTAAGACTAAIPFTIAPVAGTTVAAGAALGTGGIVGIGAAVVAVGVGVGVGVGTSTSDPIQTPSQ